MSEFKNLPSGWKVVKLGEIGKIVNGLTYSPENVSNNGLLVLRSSNISDNSIVLNNDDVYVKGISKFNKTLENDILICVRNGSKNLIGKNALITEKYKDLAFGAFMAIFRSNYNLFLIHIFKTNTFFKQVKNDLGATINSINNGNLLNFKIPLPPLDEQKKIAEILSTWDEAINLTINLIESKKQFKKALMQNLLTAKIRFPQFKEKWKEIKLGEICEIQTGKLNANAMIQGGRYKFFTCAKEVFEIDDYAFDTEAILVSGNGENVGYIHYFNGKFNAYQRTYVLDKFTENILFIKYFLEFALKRKIEIEKKDGNTPYIVLSTIFGFIVKLPNLKEQQKIAEVLTACDDEINLLNLKLENLKKQKQGLMQKLLSGKVIVWLKNIASC